MKRLLLKTTVRASIPLLLAWLLSGQCVSAGDTYGVNPKNGFVPDQATAKSIAEAVWIPIYGRKVLSRSRPFTATLVKNVWFVEGTLPGRYASGGVPYAEIDKRDGRIIRVYHDK